MTAPPITNAPRPVPRKRRWFQFSLRALLVLITLCAIPCSWLAVKIQQAKREEAAAAAIVKSGGQVEWDAKPSVSPWLRSVLGEHFFVHVQSVYMTGPDKSDNVLAPLDALDHIRLLDFFRAPITDAGLLHLRGLRELKDLSLFQTNVTDAGLDNLAGLTQLDELQLGEAKVTDAGLKKLAALNKLHTLGLSNTNVTDAGLEHLQRIKQLSAVYLVGTHVTAAGVKKLREALPNCKVTSDF